MRHKTDEELVREIMADRSAAPREKEVARRIFQLGQAFDRMEEVALTDIERGEVHHGTVH